VIRNEQAVLDVNHVWYDKICEGIAHELVDPKQKLVRTSIPNTGEAFLDAKLRSWKDARNEEGDSRSDEMEVADYVGATHASACTEIYMESGSRRNE
jgi:hypothetical protein